MNDMDGTLFDRFSPFCWGKFTSEDLVSQFNNMKEMTDGLLDDEVVAYMVLSRNGRIPINISQLDSLSDGADVTVSARVSSVEPMREFERKDGGTGTVLTINVEDGSGKCRVVIWDTKVQELFKNGEISVGTDLLIINSRSRSGLYGPELTPAKRSLVKVLSGKERSYWDRLMARSYGAQVVSEGSSFLDLKDLYGDMQYSSVDIKATVKGVGRIHEFSRKDGSMGRVTNIQLYDGTAEAVLTLWDDLAEEVKAIKIGDIVQVKNGRPKVREGLVEVHSGYYTKIQILS